MTYEWLGSKDGLHHRQFFGAWKSRGQTVFFRGVDEEPCGVDNLGTTHALSQHKNSLFSATFHAGTLDAKAGALLTACLSD